MAYHDDFTRDVANYVPQMASKWDFIGIKLHQVSLVSQLRTSEKNASQRLTIVLEEWLKGTSPPGELEAWQALVDALKSPAVNLGAVARTIKDAHIEPIRNAPRSNGQGQAMVAGNSVGCGLSRPTLEQLSWKPETDQPLLQPSSQLQPPPQPPQQQQYQQQQQQQQQYQQQLQQQQQPQQQQYQQQQPPRPNDRQPALPLDPEKELAKEKIVNCKSLSDSTPRSGQPSSTASQDPPSSSDELNAETKYCFAIMVANSNEINATMHFLRGSKQPEQFEFAEYVRECTYEGDKVLKGAIKVRDTFIKRNTYMPIKVGATPGVVVKCATMGSFTKMGSHRTTLRLVKDAEEGDWKLKYIFIVGCCGTRPKTGTPREENEQGDSESPRANKVHRDKPNEDVPLGTVLVASEIFQYAMGKLCEDEIVWKPQSCFSQPLSVDLITAQHSDMDASRIVKEIKPAATFLSGDFVVKSEYTALKLGELHDRSHVGFEMEGVGVVNAVYDAQIFLSKFEMHMPEVVLVKGVSDKAGKDKNESCSAFQFFSRKLWAKPKVAKVGEDKVAKVGELKDMVAELREDSCQQMCTIMSLTLVLRYIVQAKAMFKNS